ncbi:DEKNAAC105639 [Brettanomyces naardenensis]|uniref:Golgi apparatus membrane protein TVP23 n=1 Tax=Brettanomyces naardenensis TaxID=13370 RepID=A0A448YTM9_BRENA|nr:DEKNAAC105639 [Brettanomyces naardenensis]
MRQREKRPEGWLINTRGSTQVLINQLLFISIMSDQTILSDAPASSSSAPQQPQQSGDSVPTTLYKRLSESSHPVALLSYLILRLLPLAIYLFGLWFTSNYIFFFIIVILLLAADFWNVKNIAGRLLVGLRWWNETNDLGQAVLVFETADPNRYINPIDSRMFWLFIYICPTIWGVFAVLAVLRLQLLSLILVVVAIALATTNAMAYSQCDKFGKANVIANDVFGSVTGGFFDRMNPFRGFFNRS